MKNVYNMNISETLWEGESAEARRMVFCGRWGERTPPWRHGEGEVYNNNKELYFASSGEGTEWFHTLKNKSYSIKQVMTAAFSNICHMKWGTKLWLILAFFDCYQDHVQDTIMILRRIKKIATKYWHVQAYM